MGSKAGTDQGSQARLKIKNLVLRFRRQLGRGDSPKIYQFLQLVDPRDTEELFSRLLDIEVAFREGQGQVPTSAEYIRKFPQFRSTIHQTFMESVPEENSGDVPREPTVGDAPNVGPIDSFLDDDVTTASRLGHYELLGSLGQGAMGIVHEARDSKTGNRVALKVLPTKLDGQSVDANRLQRFRKEFRSLANINHPNLVGMQTLEVDGNQWFLTMDLIEGQDFKKQVRPNDILNEDSLRRCLPQLANGILALHQHGIVHRDLKPTNVLVDHRGRVVILDFGLVAELQQNLDITQTRTGMFVGTIPYAAPEQVYGQRTEANDWYAFGVMIYEALTGAVPFSGKNQSALLLKQQQDAPTLRLRSEIPSDLAELADGLLRRETEARWGAEEVIRFFGLNNESTRFRHVTLDSKGSQGSSLSLSDEILELDNSQQNETVLIGRENQLAELENAKSDFLDRLKPSVVWVSGRSGEGKSSLVEQFLRPLRRGTEALVLSGRCYHRESVPFNAIDCIIEPLIRYLRSPDGCQLESETLDDIEFLPFVFPAMDRVTWIQNRKSRVPRRMDPQQIRGRAFYGFRQLLDSIATKHPIVVHIDDLQWGDADSSRAWFELLNQNASLPLMMLGSYRSDEVENSPFLENWKQLSNSVFHQLESQTVTVNPLSLEECLQLAIQRTGLDRLNIHAAVRRIFEETDGNPYLFEQLLEGFNSETSEFRCISMDEIIEERLARLPVVASRMLDIVSISGRPIRVSEVAMASGSQESPHSTLKRMVNERLIRTLEGSAELLVETWHDKVRESVLSRMDARRSKKLHLRLAEQIECKQLHKAEDWLAMLANISTPGEFEFPLSDRLLDLAQNFSAAEDSRAFVYQWLSAEQAMQSYAVDEAFELFQQANKSLPSEAHSTLKYRFWMGFGRVAFWKKSNLLARDAYTEALKLGSQPSERTKANTGIASVLMVKGQIDEARHHVDLALAEMKFQIPRNILSMVFALASGTARLFAIPQRFQRPPNELARRNSIATLDALQTQLLGSNEKGVFQIISVYSKYFVASSQTADVKNVALGQTVASAFWIFFGFSWLGTVFLRQAENSIKRMNDPELLGSFHFWKGLCEYNQGRLENAEVHWKTAIPLLERCCKHHEVQHVIHMIRHNLSYRGDTRSEIERAKAVLGLVQDTENFQGICWGHYDIASAKARGGFLTEAIQHLKSSYEYLNGEDFYQTWPIRAAVHSFVRLQCSDYAVANQSANFSFSLIVRKGYVADVSLYCVPLLIESIAGPNWFASTPTMDRPKLKRELRRARFFYWSIPNHQSHIDRARGRALWRLGKRKQAIRLFEKAGRTAEQKGMKYQQAKSLLDLAAVKEEGRQSNRAEALRLLKEMNSVIPRAESWLLGDQYDEAFVAPEFDVEAWERENGQIGNTEERFAAKS